ncbi:MAG: RNA polymerase sigma factor [Clostridia bacterium]|nr:RNA polymerase sigma factor [Clostridia bacterium]MBR6603677.1 RNA polymerase sigma factor [Clostridia bacterium]
MEGAKGSYLQFLKGDDDAITEVIKEYRDGLILYLRSYTHSEWESEEICEEVFLKLILKKPHFKGESSFKTWLWRIAGNLALDRKRKSRRDEFFSIEEAENTPSEEDIFLEYLKTEQKKALHSAMKKLSEDHYRVLLLVYFENFTNSETAAIMKKSKRQVENLLYRAKCSLKKQLEKEGFIYEEL